MLQIPIVYVTDNNYVLPTAVSITSLLANKTQDTFYQINILGLQLADEHKVKLENLSSGQAQIKVIVIPENKYADCNKDTATVYVSGATYAKFDIINLLPDYDKVIYIDGDTLVLKDLRDLFITDLMDNYAGVVRGIYAGQKYNRYFDAGVMLLNLRKIREDNIYARAMRLINLGVQFKYMDQDIFNIVFEDKILFLPFIYNYMPTTLSVQKLANIYGLDVTAVMAMLKHPVIIHLAGLKKPWTYDEAPFADLWQEYFNKSAYKTEKLYKANISGRLAADDPSFAQREALLDSLSAYSKIKLSQIKQ
ncbi:MAG: glycosyltransferase family 8 protein [Candidatus Margulisbacteria bacterium]|jgi:lipopolysaccharide biosynthesis glycosyltransferase|nr:glycosyltransferase family 8 protein [Candidatus Margulisiibacteriota bacterium]